MGEMFLKSGKESFKGKSDNHMMRNCIDQAKRFIESVVQLASNNRQRKQLAGVASQMSRRIAQDIQYRRFMVLEVEDIRNHVSTALVDSRLIRNTRTIPKIIDSLVDLFMTEIIGDEHIDESTVRCILEFTVIVGDLYKADWL